MTPHNPDSRNTRLNRRTLSQIFAEYQPVERKMVTTGEADGVRYTLYEAPPADPKSDDSDTPSEE
jgi:hypothetical protein